MPGYFNLEPKPQMEITNVCPEYGIFKARLLTEEQCDQLVRMAEVFAYNTTGWYVVALARSCAWCVCCAREVHGLSLSRTPLLLPTYSPSPPPHPTAMLQQAP